MYFPSTLLNKLSTWLQGSALILLIQGLILNFFCGKFFKVTDVSEWHSAMDVNERWYLTSVCASENLPVGILRAISNPVVVSQLGSL